MRDLHDMCITDSVRHTVHHQEWSRLTFIMEINATCESITLSFPDAEQPCKLGYTCLRSPRGDWFGMYTQQPAQVSRSLIRLFRNYAGVSSVRTHSVIIPTSRIVHVTMYERTLSIRLLKFRSSQPLCSLISKKKCSQHRAFYGERLFYVRDHAYRRLTRFLLYQCPLWGLRSDAGWERVRIGCSFSCRMRC